MGQFNCGGQATVGGVVPDMASITMDIIRRLKKNKVAAAAEPARACNLARHDNVREGLSGIFGTAAARCHRCTETAADISASVARSVSSHSMLNMSGTLGI